MSDPIEIDAQSDSDHSSDSHDRSDTTSLGDFKPFVFENGRRYAGLAPGRYLLPNDDSEKERMDLEHHILLRLNSLHLAPLSNPKRILDLGTGTGRWALDMAQEYPNAEVIALDLAPIQPSWVPANMNFELADIEEYPWTFGKNSIDYIYIRFLAGAVLDWPALLKECYTTLRPGGCIEIVDYTSLFSSPDGTVGADSAIAELPRLLAEGMKRLGRQWLEVGSNSPNLLEAAGFVGVEAEDRDFPVGGWSTKGQETEEIGRDATDVWSKGIEGQILRLAIDTLGWRKEEVSVFVNSFKKELKNWRKIHPVCGVRWCVGSKPTGVASKVGASSMAGVSTTTSPVVDVKGKERAL